ncbi:hypothetical protein COO60DRAFT_1556732 [Scenedesmus sp. NREL 46B-D3]|nr:hypothetical protein COO60DRAFT_1556732 [Scenedesmus sp. NREL 46B-D3]
MTTAKVQISVNLLEKLAGIKKEPSKKQQQRSLHPSQLQLPGFGLPLAQRMAPGGHYAADSSLQQSLQQSRRVGQLLLKAEEQEVAAVKQHADELIGQYSAAPRARACVQEQLACIECYQQNATDALACSSLVDAFLACSQRAAGQLML